MLKKIIIVSLIFFVAIAVAGGAFLTWGYFYITRDLPQLRNIEDYKPAAVSKVYAADGTEIAEFFSDERRYPVPLKDIPVIIRNCFLAAEDASFYSHPGIDPISILRALWKNVRSGAQTQGGSTITQQVVKNLLLTPEKKIIRKIKEAILAYRLEHKLSKDNILEIYLNHIFFGNGAYGIKAAARAYFQKELSDLTLGEGAMLAGLPKAPAKYSPITHLSRAKRRQRYVLDQMVEAGFVSQNVADEAFKQEFPVYAADMHNIYRAPYFVSEVRRIFSERWKEYNIDTDGLEIHTTLDLNADRMSSVALRKGLKEVDKRRGWRGPIGHIDGAKREQFGRDFSGSISERLEKNTLYPALVTEVLPARGTVRVDLGHFSSTLNLKEAAWARKRLDKEDHVTWSNPEDVIRVGDVIEVSLDDRMEAQSKNGGPPESVAERLVLDQTPDIEGAVVLIDPHSGKILSTVGGYSYQRSQFNRVTQSYRQPGSAFKPVVYLAAIDGYGYTPATIVYDTPRTFKVGDQFWTPANFDEKFLGAITLRTALEKSRNLVSADIISRIGIDAAIQYAKKLGITSKLGKNLSLSLGSSEVTLLELTRVYGVFAAQGVLFDTVFITEVRDRDKKVIFDYESERLNRASQVISENSAFIMANMMKGVVEHGTGYRVKEIGRPVAGKTGTSNDQMDAWFIGYTPNWVCGVWVGFDVKKTIGEKETGGKVAAPIWLYFMRDFLAFQDKKNYEKLVEETKADAERLGISYVAPEPLEPPDFAVPDGVDPFWVDRNTGVLSSASNPGAIYEYFIKGTEPSKTVEYEQDTQSYLESPDL